MNADKIIFIVDDEKQLLFNGNTFEEVPKKGVKDYFNSATVPSSYLRSYGFKVPKSTPDEKIELQSEIKMFDEAGLDPDVDFQISYIKINLEHEENYYIESNAIEVSKLDDKYLPIVKKTSYIDFIFPPALSYLSLYAFEKLERKNDVFIHLGDDDAYAVIFRNGEYISTRTITSLNEISKKINIELEELKDILRNKGLDKTLYSLEEFHSVDIADELYKTIDRITQAIVHKTGVFKISSIDRIFLDFEGYDIPAFFEAFDERGYENTQKEILDVFKDVEVGMKHKALNALYVLAQAQDKCEVLNFSIYDRKPPFIKTNVGHFTIVMILSIIASVSYPIYAYIELEDLDITLNDLSSRVVKMDKITKSLRVKLKKEKKKKSELKEKKLQIVKKIKSYEKMVNVLIDFDKETIIRQRMMKDIVLTMKKYKLSSKHILIKDKDKALVHIVTNYYKRDNIAKFIKDLLAKNYSHVMTREVKKNNGYYESFVEIQP